MKIKPSGFISLIPRFGIEGIVYVSEKDDTDSGWEMSEDEQSLSGPNGIVIKVFDAVPVRISVEENAEKVSIDLVIEKLGEKNDEAATLAKASSESNPTAKANGGKGTKRERDVAQGESSPTGKKSTKKMKKKSKKAKKQTP